MSTGIKVSFLMLITGELILGILGNGFIGLVHCVDWVRNRKISPGDFILTNLSATRMLQLWLILFDAFIVGLSPNLYATGKLASVISTLWALCNHLTSWFATCLSVFYFLRIANFSHFFFVWLKWRVNKVVFVVFLASFFFLSVHLLVQDAITDLWVSIYRVQEGNTSLPLRGSKSLYVNHLIFLSLVYVIPFLLSLTSLLLLFLSLVRHTKKFQPTPAGLRDSSTEAHKRALKMVATFVFLFIVYFVVSQTACWLFLRVDRHHSMMVIMMFSALFPTGHSFIIILGNSKLKQIALRLLWCLKFNGREAESSAL